MAARFMSGTNVEGYPRRLPAIAKCIGCGCDDLHACCDDTPQGNPCAWLRVNYEEGKGVCSRCPEHVEAWDRRPA